MNVRWVGVLGSILVACGCPGEPPTATQEKAEAAADVAALPDPTVVLEDVKAQGYFQGIYVSHEGRILEFAVRAPAVGQTRTVEVGELDSNERIAIHSGPHARNALPAGAAPLPQPVTKLAKTGVVSIERLDEERVRLSARGVSFAETEGVFQVDTRIVKLYPPPP